MPFIVATPISVDRSTDQRPCAGADRRAGDRVAARAMTVMPTAADESTCARSHERSGASGCFARI